MFQVDAVKAYVRRAIKSYELDPEPLIYIESLGEGVFEIYVILSFDQEGVSRHTVRRSIQNEIKGSGYTARVYCFWKHQGM